MKWEVSMDSKVMDSKVMDSSRGGPTRMEIFMWLEVEWEAQGRRW